MQIHPLIKQSCQTVLPIAEKASVYLLGGIAFKILNCSLASPMFAIFGAMSAAGLAVKIFTRYDFKPVTKLKIDALQLEAKYPKLRIIAFLFTLGVGMISSTAGCCLGAIFGSYNGLIVAAEQCKRLQMIALENKTKPQRTKLILS